MLDERRKRPKKSDQFDQLLAEVIAPQQSDEGRGRRFEPAGHSFAVFQAAVTHPLRQLGQRRRPGIGNFGHDEALDLQAGGENRT